MVNYRMPICLHNLSIYRKLDVAFVYLFIYYFNLNSLFIILAFTSYDPRAASLWR